MPCCDKNFLYLNTSCYHNDDEIGGLHASVKDLPDETMIAKVVQRNNPKRSTDSLYSAITGIDLRFWKRSHRSIPPYDPLMHGPLIEYSVPDGYMEIERYWVNEPYSFISILKKKDVNYFHVVEPALTTYEKELLEILYDDLKDLLTLGKMVKREKKLEVLPDHVLQLFKRYHADLDIPSMHRIMYYLERNFMGEGRINSLLMDPFIEDISCDGPNIPVFLYHAKYRNIMTNIVYEERELNSMVIRLCQKSGKHISIGEPLVDATLPDGSRLQATLGKEITTRGSSFTIRKFRGDPITPIDLINYNTCTVEMMAYFWLAMENGNSALFAGGTASGKTSMLNAVSLFIPPLSKVVSIEDTRELMLHHDNWIAGVTREAISFSDRGEISMYDLLRSALRQRPEYILVGEVRGEEALTLFQAISTGHATYSTIHAGDVQAVVSRLNSEPLNVPRVMLHSLDIMTIQLLTFVDNEKVRRTESVVELTDMDSVTGELLVNELYKWDPLADTFRRSGESHALKMVMQARGWNQEKLEQEMTNRKIILEYMSRKQMRDYVSVSLVVQAYSANPAMVLDAIKNNTLQDMISQNI